MVGRSDSTSLPLECDQQPIEIVQLRIGYIRTARRHHGVFCTAAFVGVFENATYKIPVLGFMTLLNASLYGF